MRMVDVVFSREPIVSGRTPARFDVGEALRGRGGSTVA